MKFILVFIFLFTSIFSSNFEHLISSSHKCYENKDYLQAYINLYNAKKFASYQQWSCIDKNMELISKESKYFEHGSYIDIIYEACLKYTANISISVLKLFFLIFWYSIFILLFFYRFKKAVLIMANFILLIFLTILIVLKTNFLNSEYGIAKDVNLKIGPSLNYHDIGKVSEGEWLKILKTNDNWLLVKSKKLKGWLNRNDIHLS